MNQGSRFRVPATAGALPHSSRIDPILYCSGVRTVLLVHSGMSSHRRQKVELRCDGRSGVRIFPHAASAGHFCSGHFKPKSCTSFNFNPNVDQNFLSTRVKSMICILLEPAASRNGFAKQQFFLPFLNPRVVLVGRPTRAFRSCWELLE